MQPTKNRFYLFLLSITLISGVFLAGINQAGAVGNAHFPQNTTVALDVGNFTIPAGSDADEVTTSGTQVTVKVAAGQTFTLVSPDRKKLTNDQGLNFSCSNTESRLEIFVATGGTTQTVVITPGSAACDSGAAGGGGGGGVVSLTSTPTPTPTPTPIPTSVPASITTPAPTLKSKPTPASQGFTNLAALNLREGDVISAAGSDDPDVYIVNEHGYKRLFLNPAIFGFYGHLGGFTKVKSTVSPIRDTLVTSGLFRNCETNDEKVYGVEITGEDAGTLHWVNTSGAQAVADDPDFFKKVFCINNNEFNWYKKGTPYTSVNQIPPYARTNAVSGQPVPVASGRVKVVSTTPWLNVRNGGSLSAKIIAKVLPGEEYEFSAKSSSGWYNIKKDGVVWGWVSGRYVTEIR